MSRFQQGRVRKSAAFSIGATVALLSQLMLAPALVSAASTCNYNSTNRTITLTMAGEGTTTILARNTSGQITYGGVWCAGVATVTNTDSILITGDAQNQHFWIDLLNGGFKPGFTNETGKSDEIEFTVNLGTGSEDSVVVLGNEAAQNIVLGQTNSQFGIIRGINLNAGEGTGLDSDVALIGVESVTVYGNAGNDKIRARGGFGTGPDVFNLPLSIHAGTGYDLVRGGSTGDLLYGDGGSDQIWGHEGGDHIFLEDGVAGNDFGRGGSGVDYCVSDTSDDCQI